MKVRLGVALATLAFVCAACSGARTKPAHVTVPVHKPRLTDAYNRFGFVLFDQLEEEHPAENVVVSPASIALAIAMTANGAGGGTRAEILNTLGVPGVDMRGFDASNADLLASLRDPNADFQLSIANALWTSDSNPVHPAFQRVTNETFAATAKAVPFGQPEATAMINEWVKTNTNGLIPKVIARTDPEDAAILTNAIALKATWMEKFKSSATHDATFHAADGTSMRVRMMSVDGSFTYSAGPDWQIARLPYCCENRFAMYLLLPRANATLPEALQSLDAHTLDRAIGNLDGTSLHVEMPRYSASFASDLKGALKRMGMRSALHEGADFSALSSYPSYISHVNHSAFVRVDEAGTEAAAATSVELHHIKMARPRPRLSMIVDRPFLMVIRDDRTHQILFLGAIENPN